VLELIGLVAVLVLAQVYIMICAMDLRGPYEIFTWLRAQVRLLDPTGTHIGGLFECPWCWSFWGNLPAAYVLMRHIAPGASVTLLIAGTTIGSCALSTLTARLYLHMYDRTFNH